MRLRDRGFTDSFLVFLLFPLVYFFGPYRRTKQVSINGRRYNAYVADNFFSRAFGYMFRDPKDLNKNEAMLFVFNSPTTVTFTMSNVNFPIMVYALDEKMKVLDEALMKPGQKQKTLTGQLFLEIPVTR
ncbi:MAG: DUF192 domain-containing protein [Candidatus Micrarchaeia archaeon]